jgi:hypothetical protein
MYELQLLFYHIFHILHRIIKYEPEVERYNERWKAQFWTGQPFIKTFTKW